tara:strand:+ start:2062 stop:2301 length:240 start_codon:yes stop_codon:yes gene_type:complete
MILDPILPVDRLICTDSGCMMDPFGYALTPLFWIITGGIIIALELSGRKAKRTVAKKPRSKIPLNTSRDLEMKQMFGVP